MKRKNSENETGALILPKKEDFFNFIAQGSFT